MPDAVSCRCFRGDRSCPPLKVACLEISKHQATWGSDGGVLQVEHSARLTSRSLRLRAVDAGAKGKALHHGGRNMRQHRRSASGSRHWAFGIHRLFFCLPWSGRWYRSASLRAAGRPRRPSLHGRYMFFPFCNGLGCAKGRWRNWGVDRSCGYSFRLAAGNWYSISQPSVAARN